MLCPAGVMSLLHLHLTVIQCNAYIYFFQTFIGTDVEHGSRPIIFDTGQWQLEFLQLKTPIHFVNAEHYTHM